MTIQIYKEFSLSEKIYEWSNNYFCVEYLNNGEVLKKSAKDKSILSRTKMTEEQAKKFKEDREKEKERNSEKNLLKSMEQVEENCKKAWTQPDCQEIW